MAVKTHEITVVTRKAVDQIKRGFQEPLARVSLKPLSSASGGFLDAGPTANVEFLGEKSSPLGGTAAVQVYVFDDGEQRTVTLVALGDGGISRAVGGVKNTMSLSKSIALAERLAATV